MTGMRYNNYTQELNDVTLRGDTSMEDKSEKEDVISYDQMVLILKILMFGVTPAICIFGVVGNIFSIIILFKHGLQKCSNILLISLAAADLTFLITFNNVPKILYEVVGIENGYGYSRDVSLALFILYHILNVLDYVAAYVSLTMPMFITFERLVAVYLPFKFNLIITPTRTWCAVAVVYIFWFTVIVYMTFWWKFSYKFEPSYNISVGQMERSSLYHRDQNAGIVKSIDDFADNMIDVIPPVVTLVGCIFISAKVWVASRQRQKMTQANSKDASSNRTTKMLLAVCVVYMTACAIFSLPSYLPKYMSNSLFGDAQSNLSPVMYQVTNLALCINSSANFVVYVVMNKNFRDTYKSLFTFRGHDQICNSCFVRILCCLKK